MSLEYTPRRLKKPARFPNRIREYRLKAGITQRELGALLGLGRSVVSAWERGRILPTLPNVFRLAKALDTLAESLYLGLYMNASRAKITTDAAGA
jgi:transcriptional regulator with XRE-family HTH domain